MLVPFHNRAQVLANCKFLYGAQTDVVTFSCTEGHYQAVAIKFDPLTSSSTRFLHSTFEASSSASAISSLLHKTEIAIANLFSTNGWNLPLSGDPMQTKTLHEVQSASNADHCGQSQDSSLELITTADLKSQNDVVLEEEATQVESTTVQRDLGIESAGCESLQEEIVEVQETPDYSCAVVDEEAPVESYGWGSWASKKKKKKKVISVAEEPEPPQYEPGTASPDDYIWGFSSNKKCRKKRTKGYNFGEQLEQLPFEPERASVEDYEWTGFGGSMKGSIRKSRNVIEEPIVDDTPSPDPEPQHVSIGDDDALETFNKDQERKRQSSDEDVLKMAVTINGLPIETVQAPAVMEASKPSTTTAPLTQTVITDLTNRSPVVKTVVLKIIHTSKTGTQTVQTILNIAYNTKKAICDAVDQYLNCSSEVRYSSICRSIDIKFGSGKNGDLDLSALEENRWPEYLEYLSQYTRFPELTVHVSD